MKVNELMIGDWVVYNGDVDYINPIKIEGMDFATGMCITTDRDDVGFDGVWPIPLTAEILEKNGFIEFMPHNWQIVINNIMIELREPEHNMAIWLDWDEHDTGTYASYMFPRPNCVHELQHALRLCNIDKEIEL